MPTQPSTRDLLSSVSAELNSLYHSVSTPEIKPSKIYLSIYHLFVSKNFANYKNLESYQYNLILKDSE